MISMGKVFFMFCFQQLCQQNPVLLISIGLSFTSFPFIVTRSIYTHDLAKKTYGISGSERINDFELFSLPVRNFFRPSVMILWNALTANTKWSSLNSTRITSASPSKNYTRKQCPNLVESVHPLDFFYLFCDIIL